MPKKLKRAPIVTNMRGVDVRIDSYLDESRKSASEAMRDAGVTSEMIWAALDAEQPFIVAYGWGEQHAKRLATALADAGAYVTLLYRTYEDA